MTTVSIDVDVLDNLFENQKKLDDIFDSMFDDDFSASSSISLNNKPTANKRESTSHTDMYSDDFWATSTDDNTNVQQKTNLASFLIPMVLEIAAIYYGIVYFT